MASVSGWWGHSATIMDSEWHWTFDSVNVLWGWSSGPRVCVCVGGVLIMHAGVVLLGTFYPCWPFKTLYLKGHEVLSDFSWTSGTSGCDRVRIIYFSSFFIYNDWTEIHSYTRADTWHITHIIQHFRIVAFYHLFQIYTLCTLIPAVLSLHFEQQLGWEQFLNQTPAGEPKGMFLATFSSLSTRLCGTTKRLSVKLQPFGGTHVECTKHTQDAPYNRSGPGLIDGPIQGCQDTICGVSNVLNHVTCCRIRSVDHSHPIKNRYIENLPSCRSVPLLLCCCLMTTKLSKKNVRKNSEKKKKNKDKWNFMLLFMLQFYISSGSVINYSLVSVLCLCSGVV